METVYDQLKKLVASTSQDTWKLLGVSFIAFILPVILFVQLADEVIERDTLPFDEAILLSVNSFASPGLDRLVLATTDLGYVWWVGFGTIVTLLIALRAKRYTDALVVAMGVAGSALVNLVLKLLFQRDRPELWERLVTENSFSFPSGHAMASASLAAVIMIVLWPTKWRWLGVIAGLAYVVYIGFTRLYLGVHYPTDVLAGWLVAGSWVAISTIIIVHISRRRSRKRL